MLYIFSHLYVRAKPQKFLIDTTQLSPFPHSPAVSLLKCNLQKCIRFPYALPLFRVPSFVHLSSIPSFDTWEYFNFGKNLTIQKRIKKRSSSISNLCWNALKIRQGAQIEWSLVFFPGPKDLPAPAPSPRQEEIPFPFLLVNTDTRRYFSPFFFSWGIDLEPWRHCVPSSKPSSLTVSCHSLETQPKKEKKKTWMTDGFYCGLQEEKEREKFSFLFGFFVRQITQLKRETVQMCVLEL